MSASGLKFTILNQNAGVNGVVLNQDSDDEYSASLSGGRRLDVVLESEVLDGPLPNDSTELSYLRFGQWAISNASTGAVGQAAPIIGGYETPDASMPTSGTALYRADVEGAVSFALNGTRTIGEMEGSASITANFGSNQLTGQVTGTSMSYDTPNNYVEGQWNDFSFGATLTGNSFAGTTAVTSTPGGTGALITGAAGTVSGAFYGPNANEIGAIWTLSDGTTTALGTIAGAKQ